MSFLRKHWHKVCFGILVLICATVVTLHVDQSEPESFVQLETDIARLHAELEANHVSKDYRYGDEAQARLPQRRQEVDVPAFAAARTVYPRPSKPSIDPASIVKPAEIVEKKAELPAPALRTATERGRIRVEFQLPDAVNMTLLRADIYRGEGTDPNTLDTRLPFASVDLKTATRVEKNWISFADTHVEPKHVYQYSVRLVAAIFANRVEKDEAGHIVREIHYLPPALASTFPEDTTQRYFASPLSAVVNDVSPSNFEIRFSGTIGSVPLAGADTLAQDYSGRFVVRIWITEIQEWKEATLELHPGDRLSGKVLYKPSPKADLKACVFDTGKVLEEIRRESVARVATVHDQVTDENHAPVLDENNQPKTAARTVKTSGIPVDIAVLKDSETGTKDEMRIRN